MYLSIPGSNIHSLYTNALNGRQMTAIFQCLCLPAYFVPYFVSECSLRLWHEERRGHGQLRQRRRQQARQIRHRGDGESWLGTTARHCTALHCTGFPVQNHFIYTVPIDPLLMVGRHFNKPSFSLFSSLSAGSANRSIFLEARI